MLVAPRYDDEADQPGILRARGRRVPFDPEDRFVSERRLSAVAAGAGDFDLVHVQTPFSAHRAGVRLARAWGVPLVETWHTDFEHYFEHYARFVPAPLARRIARALARRIGREVDHLVVPSSAIDAGLGALGVSTPRTVVPTGLAATEFAPADGARFRAAHGIALDRPVAVHVGRIAHEKNLRFLLEVADRVRRTVNDFLLVVAGEGPALADLHRRAAELGLDGYVRFVGYLERRQALPDCYRAGDLFVFASKTETQGLVLLEAMALGVPVVALAEQGTKDLLADGRGALVPRDDPDDFAAAVVRVLRDETLRARLAAEAPAVAAGWSAPALAGRLAELYRSLVAAPSRPRRAAAHAAV